METTLLEYVIEYLKEELDRGTKGKYTHEVQELVDLAIDAYEGGAR